MKIEIDKKTGAIIGLGAVVLFLAGMLISGNNSTMGMNTNSQSQYSTSDLMFAQMMIPHHQQAVEMSDIALANSKNEKVLRLAEQIKSAQAPEIEQMKGWLSDAGQNLMGSHGMDMDGMLSETEILALKASTGVEFDRLFLKGMIAHHQGALSMVVMIEDSENAEAKKLAADIKSSQSAEVTLMESYLKGL